MLSSSLCSVVRSLAETSPVPTVLQGTRYLTVWKGSSLMTRACLLLMFFTSGVIKWRSFLWKDDQTWPSWPKDFSDRALLVSVNVLCAVLCDQPANPTGKNIYVDIKIFAQVVQRWLVPRVHGSGMCQTCCTRAGQLYGALDSSERGCGSPALPTHHVGRPYPDRFFPSTRFKSVKT